MRRMTTTDNNIKMDLESSMGKDKDVPHEETVEELIRKLNMKGTKVKVLKDGDNAETPQPATTRTIPRSWKLCCLLSLALVLAASRVRL